MNITSNVTNPSFTARLKRDKTSEEFVKSLDDNQLKGFKQALNKLSKVYPNDVLELGKWHSDGEGRISPDTYCITNTNDKSQYQRDTEVSCTWNENSVIEALNKIATKGTEEYKKMFSVNIEQAKEAEQAKKDEQRKKNQQAVLDLMV